MKACPKPGGLEVRSLPESIVHLAERIVATVRPEKVVLYGSHARWDAHRRSDVDLLVVLQDGRGVDLARQQAREATRESDTPLDIVMFSAPYVHRFGQVVGTVVRAALREGRLLYDAQAPVPWNRGRPSAVVPVSPVTEEARRG